MLKIVKTFKVPVVYRGALLGTGPEELKKVFT